MSRLHDMKNGVIKKAVKKVEDITSKQVGKQMRSLESKLKGQDPEKVRGFLTDIVSDTSFPAPMRSACQKLLDGMSPEDILKKSVRDVAEDVAAGKNHEGQT